MYRVKLFSRIIWTRHLFKLGIGLALVGICLMITGIVWPTIPAQENVTTIDSSGVHITTIVGSIRPPVASTIGTLGILPLVIGGFMMVYAKVRKIVLEEREIV